MDCPTNIDCINGPTGQIDQRCASYIKKNKIKIIIAAILTAGIFATAGILWTTKVLDDFQKSNEENQTCAANNAKETQTQEEITKQKQKQANDTKMIKQTNNKRATNTLKITPKRQQQKNNTNSALTYIQPINNY